MLIDVVIERWAQDCCGEPFEVGGQATWQIAATSSPPAQPLRFVEEYHGQSPADVPLWAVTGAIVAITGISYPTIPVPGMMGAHTSDRTSATEHPLAAVSGPNDDDGCSEYRVLLEVAEGTELPAHVDSAVRNAQREREANTAMLNRQRMSDSVGVQLEALAEEAEHRYAGTASMTRSDDRSAMTLRPHRADAAGISWSRDADSDDGISVQVGDGRWHFPATGSDVAVLQEFLLAAVAGRVNEHVRPVEAPSRLDTEVRTSDGRCWTATTAFAPFARTGFMVVARPLWDRVNRGEYRYAPWTGASTDPPRTMRQ